MLGLSFLLFFLLNIYIVFFTYRNVNVLLILIWLSLIVHILGCIRVYITELYIFLEEIFENITAKSFNSSKMFFKKGEFLFYFLLIKWFYKK